MNKKILIFLVVALGALSIMTVSIWGTLPESQSLPRISTLNITKFDRQNNSGEKILFVKDIITEEEYTYRIDFTVSPEDADQDGIKAKADMDDGVAVSSFSADHYVMVTFTPAAIGKAVTITIWDIKTMEDDSVTLLFTTESEVDIDDPDVFE